MTWSPVDAHVFVDDLSAPVPGDGDRHHLTRVLRLRDGATVTAADGHGRWRPCRLTGTGGLEPVGEIAAEAPDPAVTVAFALVKGQRPELVVQKLTELGVDRIIPFTAERSVVRWDPAKAARNLARFAEIARQAAMQCRRTYLPAVGWPDTETEGNDCSPSWVRLPAFHDVSMLSGAVLADGSGRPVEPGTRTILIGPEGGWTTAERDAGLPAVRLAPHVLRAETAAITAGALLLALRSDIISPSVPREVAASPRL